MVPESVLRLERGAAPLSVLTPAVCADVEIGHQEPENNALCHQSYSRVPAAAPLQSELEG